MQIVALTLRVPAAVAALRRQPAAGPAAAGAGGSGSAGGRGGCCGASAGRRGPRRRRYGRGTLYAAPVANAPSEAPADGKTGYIPGAASPDNQPKPPE